MLFKVLIFAYLLHYVDGWSIVTSHPIEQPEPRLMTLEEVYDSQDTFRLNDVEVGLTAYKDKKLLSCFVNDYDPYWQPAPDDRRYFLENQPCEKVNLNTDYKTLKKKAGPKIARMCKELYIFWLAARNMGPPPLPGMAQQQQTPCRFQYDDDLVSAPINDDNSQISEQTGRSGNVGPGQSRDDSAPPRQQDRAPPMLQNGAPRMLQNGAPPMSQDGAPPMMQDGAPRMSQDGAPPLMQDGAAPMMQDGAPPMFNEGAPPVTHDGAPPMLHGAPPMLHDGAPPMSNDGAPPMSNDGAPPMSNDGAPPMFKDGEMRPPPLLQNMHSRRDLDGPSLIKTPPPLNILAAITARTTHIQPEEKIPNMAPVWKRMVGQIKDTQTMAPPTPDMKSPPPPAIFRRNM